MGDHLAHQTLFGDGALAAPAMGDGVAIAHVAPDLSAMLVAAAVAHGGRLARAASAAFRATSGRGVHGGGVPNHFKRLLQVYEGVCTAIG
jgi:hypothetical protein